MIKGIKSKLIFKLVFINLKKVQKLKLIKYNKYIQNILNITLRDFTESKSLKQFNQKYNVFIKDTDIQKIDLSLKKVNNECLEELYQLEFTELKELILYTNNITDIRPLKKLN